MEDANSVPGHSGRKVTHADLTRVNLPKAFWGAKTEDIRDKDVRNIVIRYRTNIVDMVQTGSGLLFYGLPGVGKTSAAACILKEAISAGRDTYFVTYVELKEIRSESMKSSKEALYGSGNDGITVRRKIETTQLLVIDGVNESLFVDNMFGPLQMEEMLARRAAQKLATIMTIRSVVTLQSDKWSDLFEAISQSMVAVQIDGKNLRDSEKARLMKRVLGDGRP